MKSSNIPDLVSLAIKHGSDKWGGHYYAKHYDRFFEQKRSDEIVLLEIGIGGYDIPNQGGASLKMWEEYFPNARICGIDIHDKAFLDGGRIRTFRGAQNDPDFLSHVVSEIGSPDIIIDDGSHINEHVLKSFQFLFPLLNNGGIYVVEDTQTSYWPHRGGDSFDMNKKGLTMPFLKGLTDGLNYKEFDNPFYAPTYTDQNIVGLHFFHNLCFVEKGINQEGSNMVKNNRLGQFTRGQNLRYYFRRFKSFLSL